MELKMTFFSLIIFSILSSYLLLHCACIWRQLVKEKEPFFKTMQINLFATEQPTGFVLTHLNSNLSLKFQVKSDKNCSYPFRIQSCETQHVSHSTSKMILKLLPCKIITLFLNLMPQKYTLETNFEFHSSLIKNLISGSECQP